MPDFPFEAARNALFLPRRKRDDFRNGFFAPRDDHLFPVLDFTEQL